MKRILFTSIATVIVLLSMTFKSNAIQIGANSAIQGFVTLNIDLSGIDPAMILPECSADLYTGDALDFVIPVPGTSSKTPINIKSDRFTLKLPMKSEVAYLKLHILKRSWLSNSSLIVSTGDSLSIKLDKNEFKIISENSSTIDAQIKFRNSVVNSNGLVLQNANDIPIAFNKCDSIIHTNQLKPNNKNDKAISVYNQQVDARTKTRLLDLLLRAGKRGDEVFRTDIYNFLKSKQESWRVVSNETDFRDVFFLPLSIYLYNQILVEFGPKSESSFFSNMYENIRNNYPQFLADKATAYLFWKHSNKLGYNQLLLEKAISNVKDSTSLAVMNEIWKTKRQGTPAFNFELPDEQDKIRSLKEFRGKTVVVHLWFTGCRACTKMAKYLSPIAEKLKSNIQFISVSVDTDRNIWLKSLKSGAYTGKEELNLYTNGLGSDHPFVKYYNFKGFPCMLIIDASGHLITANPPTPNFGATGEQFEEYIRNCIK